MQDYTDIAAKNGIELIALGPCQFCGAATERGVHECVELFSLGFDVLDFGKAANHLYRFLSVDAHTLQHAEIHGRWNNHFHLLRLHLILQYDIQWRYELSPKLSNYLNRYKVGKEKEYLASPPVLRRGTITTSDVALHATNELECKKMIAQWAQSVYEAWSIYHEHIDVLAKEFVAKNKLE